MNDLKMPELIQIGTQGWKIRETERLILEMVNRSTTPQSGWTIRLKLRRKKQAGIGGKQLCILMQSLCYRGYLERIGFDYDHDSTYKIPTKKEI